MPPSKKPLIHGTRSCYVRAKCRCEECRAANRAYYHDRQKKIVGLASLIPKEEKRVAQVWTPPGKKPKKRYYRMRCRGVGGQPCPKNSHLRKDSKGGICGYCREKLLKRVLIPTDEARAHLLALSAKGVGLRAVAEGSGVAYSCLQDIKNRGQKLATPDVVMRIMKVDENMLLDHHTVDGTETWKRIKEMQKTGMSKAEIARRLGYKNGAIQFKKRVLAKTELAVKKLHKLVMEEEAIPDIEPGECLECGLSHHKEDRKKLIARMLPCQAKDITETYPCIYPLKVYSGKSYGENRTLVRDLHEVDAVAIGGIWYHAKDAPRPRDKSASEGDLALTRGDYATEVVVGPGVHGAVQPGLRVAELESGGKGPGEAAHLRVELRGERPAGDAG